MHRKQLYYGGQQLNSKSKVFVMLHGRGANAEDIMSLSAHLHTNDFSIVAPQATNNTWYPYSFLAPPAQNEPWLSSAIDLVHETILQLHKKEIPPERIFFLGFSQGACLTLEFVTRHAMRYGGVIAFTGGLIGDKLYQENYKGNFQQTPVFIGTSDPDPHVPLERVHATANLMTSMNANVLTKVYPGMGHTINEDELREANRHVLDKADFHY